TPLRVIKIASCKPRTPSLERLEERGRARSRRSRRAKLARAGSPTHTLRGSTSAFVRRKGRAMKTLLYASLLAASLLPLTGCKRQSHEGAPEIHKAYIGPELSPTSVVGPDEAARRACEARMREVLRQPELPGAPAVESQRSTLLARTKAEP